MTPRLDTGRYQRIVILTGAGVSAASDLPTFRGPGGLWTDPDLVTVADARAMRERPADVWRFFGPLRTAARGARPNPGHRAIADLQQARGGEPVVTLITQNVDGLHGRAGSPQVIEVHGSLFRTRCSRTSCDLPGYDDPAAPAEALPFCPRCQAPLRPDVVLFEEMLPADADHRVRQALRECDLFVAVGTSGTVYPASTYVRGAAYAGARTVLVNLEPMDPPNPAFHEEYLGRAEELLPLLLR